jgi:lipopolysaccharide export system permease protein
MTTLDRYLLSRTGSALAKTLVALVGMYVLIDLLTHRRSEILKHDVPWTAVVEYYAVLIPQIVYATAPLALLVSALLVLGIVAQDNEMTAALAGGISLRRFVRMPIALALCFALTVFLMEEALGAPAARRAKHLDDNYFSRTFDTARKGVSWSNLAGNWTCHIMKFNRLALTGEGVVMHSIRADAVEHIMARRIYWDEVRRRWMIEDGRRLLFDPAVNVELDRQRITQSTVPIRETPEELFSLEQPAEAKTVWALASQIRWAGRRGAPAERLRVFYHAKFARPALSFVMIWLAIPFAMRLRRGGLAISFGAGIGIALLYLMIHGFGMALGETGRLAPVWAAWLANAVFLGVGVILFARTPT